MFGPATQQWFDATFPEPTEVQRRGWEVIARGAHALLVAPTGSGKTLAAFLAGIDAMTHRAPEAQPGTRVLYVSPLKALVYDVERNLRAPLAGIRFTAERLGIEFPSVEVAVRTGDTPQRERQRQIRQPGDILVTTPESLFLILGSRACETLTQVETVIVDEVHALAPTKRGAHLALSLERLSELAVRDPQRIGLSATVRPLDEVARYLGGDREVATVDASAPPKLDLRVTVPVPDMTQVTLPPKSEKMASGGSVLGDLYDREVHTPTQERGIWPAIYPELLEEIRSNRSTIIFTNSRGLCERLAERLNEQAGEEAVLAHHGSVSHERRAEIEEGLKGGRLRGIVATSSLELGIDMGAVDRVILVESPGSVSRGLQRVGRAGHQVGETSVGRIYPKFRGDLLEAAVVSRLMLRGELESLRVPQNTLDVLAQQIVAMCVQADCTVAEVETMVARSYPFHALTRAALESVLDMLSGKYPSADLADLRPLLNWDRTRDVLSARRGAPMVSRMNAGTIPDRGHYAVHLGEGGPRVGELDEEMVFETRRGDVIRLGATTWRVEEVTRDRVLVTPAPGEPGRLPFWKGEGPGRPIELGRAIGAFLGELDRVPEAEAVDWLMEHAPLDVHAASNLAAYVAEQRAHTGMVPTDRVICVERFRDELGDWRVCLLTPFGARIHAPWAMAIQRLLARRSGFETQVMYSEDGVVVRLADLEADELPELSLILPDPDEVEDLLTEQLSDTALFAGLFRENAVRSLMLPRRRPTQRNPLWAQRLKAQQLMATVRQYPSFPVVLETYRQALRDVFDLPALIDLMRDIRMRRVRVQEVTTPSASPFARSLVFAYVASYMYDQDVPIAERRLQALTIDRQLLQELIGYEETRDLIDPEVLDLLEAELQCLMEDRWARTPDELHDLLRRLGDLSLEEMERRCAEPPEAWLRELEATRRVAHIRIAGEDRWIVAEDAALYRDGLGVLPPAGLPSAFLEVAESPLPQLVRRYARHHGPFGVRDLARRYDLSLSRGELVLRELENAGTLVSGEIRPGGVETDYCDAEVLRRLKRWTLARLRKEVAPVDARTLGSFLPQWHGVGSAAQGLERLLEVIAQLEGLALPWSELCDVILPQRVPRFSVEQLNALCSMGAVVWVGRSSLGPRDGRVALYLREHAAALVDFERDEGPDEEAVSRNLDDVHRAILAALSTRGASFGKEIERAVLTELGAEVRSEDVRAALWDLVWWGQVTNDTFGALEELRRRSSGGSRRVVRRRGGATLSTAGRWWRVEELQDGELSVTERQVALARLLLERYGVVSREATQAESIRGGFSSVYRVLGALEEAGQVRRGYFVEGLSGAQFASPGSVDRLRAVRPDDDTTWSADDVVVLSAIDPANPYGALLPWPAGETTETHKVRRVAGASVLLLGGHPAVYVAPGGRQLWIFPFPGQNPVEVLRAALPALRRIPKRRGKKRLRIEEINGRPAEEFEHVETVRACGFERGYRGLVDSTG